LVFNDETLVQMRIVNRSNWQTVIGNLAVVWVYNEGVLREPELSTACEHQTITPMPMLL